MNLSPLGGAFAECGRIDKTLHLLAVVDPVDDTYRRRMNRQLTVQESRHRLARAICHGKHALALFRDLWDTYDVANTSTGSATRTPPSASTSMPTRCGGKRCRCARSFP